MSGEKVLNLLDMATAGEAVSPAGLGQSPLTFAEIGGAPFQLRQPVFDNSGRFREGPAVRGPEMLCAVRDCFLLGPFGAVVLPNGMLIRQSVINLESDTLQYSLAQFTGQFPGTYIPWTAAPAPVFAVNSYATNNYFHFMVDSLAQLHWTSRLPAQVKWIISGYPPAAEATLPFIPSALSAAGITRAALQPFDGTLLHCPLVVFPRRVTGADPARIDWLRRTFGVAGRPRGYARLYITRAGARRRLVNEDSLVQVLERFGFTTIDPSGLSVAEQAARFSEAAIVVGSHGAALTNAGFMAPGAALIELTHQARIVPTYHELASAAGLAYGVVVGTATGNVEHPILADFSVPPEAAAAAVEAALKAL
jgi:capsular polysaccharide biosynthesis protein